MVLKLRGLCISGYTDVGRLRLLVLVVLIFTYILGGIEMTCSALSPTTLAFVLVHCGPVSGL